MEMPLWQLTSDRYTAHHEYLAATRCGPTVLVWNINTLLVCGSMRKEETLCTDSDYGAFRKGRRNNHTPMPAYWSAFLLHYRWTCSAPIYTIPSRCLWSLLYSPPAGQSWSQNHLFQIIPNLEAHWRWTNPGCSCCFIVMPSSRRRHKGS